MSKRPAAGLFDEQRKGEQLARMNDVLVRLSAMVDWEAFRPLIERSFPVRDPRKGGQPPYDRLLLFKMVVLGRLYQLSPETLEYQVHDRMSFRRFLGLELQHAVPDATTIRLFVEHMITAGAMPDLFAQFHERLSRAGLVLNEGKILDASIVSAPVQRNSKEENERIKDNDVPEDWSEQKRRQKDVDASWTKKHGKNYFGYKNHVKVDAGSKLIDHYEVTTACVADGHLAWQLLDPKDQGQALHADKGYDWGDVRRGVRKARMKDRILKQARARKPLTKRQQRDNTESSRIRARVEHVFGAMDKQLGGLFVTCIGQARATFHVGLTNFCYNLQRTLTLLSKKPFVGSV